MKSFQSFSFTVVGLSLVLSACSGQGNSDISNGVAECAPNANIVDMNYPDSKPNKLTWEKLGTVKPGMFVAAGATVYYIDPEKGPNDNFRVAVVETSSVDDKTKTRSYKTATSCFRGARADLQNVGVTVQTLSKVTIGADASGAATFTDMEMHDITYTIDAKGRTSNTTKVSESKLEKIADFQAKGTQSFLIKKSEDELELRLKGETQTTAGQTGTYYLSVILVRQK